MQVSRLWVLLASLDSSLRRLSEEQRAILPRLALFEGGASEARLLAITEIPEAEWVTLRQALEQAALLTAEQIHEGVSVPFLRFHPVLAPYLRSQSGADNPPLRERYAQRYYSLANYLYDEDKRSPQPVRALVRRELPNLRQALNLLLEIGELDSASDMADRIARFLSNFGLQRELDELRQQVVVAVASAPAGETLTQAEYLRESGLGGDEWRKGDLRAAYTRFTNLLERIEELPEGTPLGRGSYEHCLTLDQLARCLRTGGQPAAAEGLLRQALAVIDKLIKQKPDKQGFVREHGSLLGEMGDVLRDEGKYLQARRAYVDALKVDEQLGDLRNQAVDLGQLGALALKQHEYAEARTRYTAALENFRALGEPRSEAVVWHQLGRVAEEQKEWEEAERCYRESLALKERQGNAAGAADTCNQLAITARGSGRPIEAEGWYQQALELYELVQPGSLPHARSLNNLAFLLLNEVQAGPAPIGRMSEARVYAERALAIKETLDASSGIWSELRILAEIADLEGRADAARDYRRRERETFAAFAGNRYHIDRQHGRLIADIAEAAKGNVQAREAVEAALPKLEEDGWSIASATKRIWEGERNWHSLVEDLDRQDALLMLRVLETMEQPNVAESTEAQDITPEQVIASLPAAIREALTKGNQAAFEQALRALPAEEQQAVMEAMRYLQARQEEEEDEESDVPGGDDVVQQFEPLLWAIAAVVMGDATHRGEIEEVLADLEEKGWHLKEAVQRLWEGERDAEELTKGLDEQDSAVVLRVLEIIGEGGG